MQSKSDTKRRSKLNRLPGTLKVIPAKEPELKIFEARGATVEDTYNALREHPEYDNFRIMPCTCNGDQALAIVAIFDDGKTPEGLTQIGMKPLFISVTPSMDLINEDGQKAVTRQEMERKRAAARLELVKGEGDGTDGDAA